MDETALITDTYGSLRDALRERNLVSSTDMAKAERLLSAGERNSLPSVLLDMGMLSEADLAQQLADISNNPLISAAKIPEECNLEGVSPRFLKEFCIAVLYSRDNEVGVAITDPYMHYIQNALKLALNKKVTLHVGVRSELEAAVLRQNQTKDDDTMTVVNADDDIEHLRDIASEAPVIRFVSNLFQRAVKEKASDIHLETTGSELSIRLRIDGVLKEVDSPQQGMEIGVISRVKLLAKLNIAERRLPQDGKIRSQINGQEYDMRVSTAPTIHGEGVVIRILDRSQISLEFKSLGFSDTTLERFLDILSLPHGVILITGPTGSGKTTTLYTALTKLNKPESKIITIEDPVEYELNGINQIQVKPDIGLDFSSILRSIVRQDPDIIMIGEMRDVETANIAVQSALTGHLVLSTLHTNDAASGIIRLHDMGVDDFLLASTVTGILAQRLVRKLCDNCKQAYAPSKAVLKKLGLKNTSNKFYSPVGCKKCSDTGYQGRLAIIELLKVTDSIKEKIMSRATSTDILNCALNEGMITMFEDGVDKITRGLTTIEEVMRVTKQS